MVMLLTTKPIATSKSLQQDHIVVIPIAIGANEKVVCQRID